MESVDQVGIEEDMEEAEEAYGIQLVRGRSIEREREAKKWRRRMQWYYFWTEFVLALCCDDGYDPLQF